MLRRTPVLLKHSLLPRPALALRFAPVRLLATQAAGAPTAAAAPPLPVDPSTVAKAKRVAKTTQEGNISSVFASLSGEGVSVLPDRFIDLKKRIINPQNAELVKEVTRSWASLLAALEVETQEIKRRGPNVSH